MRSVGSEYEKVAVEFLKGLGYDILEINYRTRFSEVDIIAEIDEYIVFVEVKYRACTKYGYPCESVNLTKRRKIMRTAQLYMSNVGEKQCRFDVVGISDGTIRHWINAF